MNFYNPQEDPVYDWSYIVTGEFPIAHTVKAKGCYWNGEIPTASRFNGGVNISSFPPPYEFVDFDFSDYTMTAGPEFQILNFEDDLYLAGLQQFIAEDYSEAAVSFNDYIESNPEDTHAWPAASYAVQSTMHDQGYSQAEELYSDYLLDYADGDLHNTLVLWEPYLNIMADSSETGIINAYGDFTLLRNEADNLIDSLVCELQMLILEPGLPQDEKASLNLNARRQNIQDIKSQLAELKAKERDESVLGVELPDEFSLQEPYPNPFNSSLRVDFDLPIASKVILKIYNIQGREVTSLLNEPMVAGEHRVMLDGKALSSGVYFVGMIAGAFVQVKKVVLLK